MDYLYTTSVNPYEFTERMLLNILRQMQYLTEHQTKAKIRSKMNQVCERLKNIRISGNMVPATWYRAIRTEQGRADLVAIAILSDILFWYKPTSSRDEVTNKVEYKQKFKYDKLQKKYSHYAELLGVSEKTVKTSFKNLRRLELITTEFRKVITDGGSTLQNVMYIDLNLDAVIRITESDEGNKVYSGRKFLHSGREEFGGTYTDNTTKKTTRYNYGIDDVPKRIFDWYKTNHGKLPGVRSLNSQRIRLINTCIANHGGEGEAWGKEFCEAVSVANKTPFMYGEGKNKWRANFDWFIENDVNIEKTLEGAYGNKQEDVFVL